MHLNSFYSFFILKICDLDLNVTLCHLDLKVTGMGGYIVLIEIWTNIYHKTKYELNLYYGLKVMRSSIKYISKMS